MSENARKVPVIRVVKRTVVNRSKLTLSENGAKIVKLRAKTDR